MINLDVNRSAVDLNIAIGRRVVRVVCRVLHVDIGEASGIHGQGIDTTARFERNIIISKRVQIAIQRKRANFIGVAGERGTRPNSNIGIGKHVRDGHDIVFNVSHLNGSGHDIHGIDTASRRDCSIDDKRSGTRFAQVALSADFTRE